MPDKITIVIFDDPIKLFPLDRRYNFFPSTTTILEIAFTNVSIVLTVNDMAKIIIIIDKNSVLSFKRILKKKNRLYQYLQVCFWVCYFFLVQIFPRVFW